MLDSVPGDLETAESLLAADRAEGEEGCPSVPPSSCKAHEAGSEPADSASRYHSAEACSRLEVLSVLFDRRSCLRAGLERSC